MHRWKDNFRIDLRDVQWEVTDWIHVAQNRDQWRDLENMITKSSIKGGELHD
jgi:hypothetical protein